ncbi:hypothetical protein BDU57DRAFT_523572 [Ampelomyces quisqualis]|uniref:Domain of unknown function at the cortex 1 domain-containing protein n=1 Tax=Ampelomyces quisqualis TaxID=50730 RepID=A0A6A5QD54_AMPQU|nr:hypothetical protein BDU57DRAFT_523572 [Ampelomyces quisqualis]
MGFDYDHSIKHQLPPGFKYAMKIATSILDPGLYSDAYCDEPYLYGPALSGLFTLNIGERTDKVSAEDQLAQLSRETCGVVEEGSSGSGTAIRSSLSIPPKWKKRRKHFLDPAALANFTFEKGRMYHADFFNPHLDFANFSLRLPGFSISVAKYIDEKTHHLRFVLKDRNSGEVCFVVFFKLLFGEELQATLEANKGGNEKREGPNRDEHATSASSDEQHEAHSSASTAAASLSNNITAALVAMGLWDDASSSSASEKHGHEHSPQPSGQSLEARVDEMDDATVERYLQSRHGSTP